MGANFLGRKYKSGRDFFVLVITSTTWRIRNEKVLKYTHWYCLSISMKVQSISRTLKINGRGKWRNKKDLFHGMRYE